MRTAVDSIVTLAINDGIDPKKNLFSQVHIYSKWDNGRLNKVYTKRISTSGKFVYSLYITTNTKYVGPEEYRIHI